MGKALLVFAERLRAEPEPTTDQAPATDGTPNQSKLGATQMRILEMPAEAPEGLTATEVARQAKIAPTNAPRALRALEDRQLVEKTEDSPIVWRRRQQPLTEQPRAAVIRSAAVGPTAGKAERRLSVQPCHRSPSLQQ